MAAYADLVRFIPTLGGTTDWTYSSAVGGCQSPTAANVQNGVSYKLYAVSNDLTQWEISSGAYNSSTGVFARTTVLYNSSGTGSAAGQSGVGTKINFSTVPQVSIVALAEDLIAPAATVQRFTATGAGTYNPTSSAVRFIKVKLVGGGGGGANATAAAGQTNLGSGGGGGGYVEHIMAAGSYSYVVGAGGAAQSNGADTTFNSGALVASGGGGTSFTTGSGTTLGRPSGTSSGGAASGGNAENIPGENGDVAFRYSGSEGICARGGKSFLSVQSGQTLVGAAAAGGQAGKAYGGGGGGAGSGSASAATGGAGADGVVIVEEYY